MRTLVCRGRHLAWDDGSPFFYLADTAWELFHALTREEVIEYLDVRQREGFTAIQCVLLAEFGGLTQPNAYGHLPLACANGLPDPTQPLADGDDTYWTHVDFVLDEAARRNLFLTILPTWGDKFNRLWGEGPEIFTPENAAVYGAWLARRLAHRWNVIWMLGGDRPLEPRHRQIIDAMAHAIRQHDHGNHLICFHPPGEHNSTDYLADADYIDMHCSQTGHAVGQCYASDQVMRTMAAATPKPYWDAEPRYEGHPACFNASLGHFWQQADVRQNAWWNVFAGACGHTYGHHCVWRMVREPSDYFPCTWQEGLRAPGADQLRHLVRLRLEHEPFDFREARDLLVGDAYDGQAHLAAARAGHRAYVYSPLGLPFTVDCHGFSGKAPLRAWWLNPRSGERTLFGVYPPSGRQTFVPPSQGRGHDWTLILDDRDPAHGA